MKKLSTAISIVYWTGITLLLSCYVATFFKWNLPSASAYQLNAGTFKFTIVLQLVGLVTVLVAKFGEKLSDRLIPALSKFSNEMFAWSAFLLSILLAIACFSLRTAELRQSHDLFQIRYYGSSKWNTVSSEKFELASRHSLRRQSCFIMMYLVLWHGFMRCNFSELHERKQKITKSISLG